jgi:ABC-type sugar transport system ATPase subunit
VSTGERPLLAARGVTRHFGGITALSDVSIELVAGETHTLVGENGSGKSTLGRILTGTLQPDSGEVEVDGEAVVLPTPKAALARGIVVITQELTLAPTLTVTENILLGRLPTRHGLVRWAEARRMARGILDEAELDIDVSELVGDLSIEQRQEVEIARALSTPARAIVLDEATSSLSERAIHRLLTRLEQLRASGTAVLFISHRLPEIYAIGQRATVLRDGHRVGTFELADTPPGQLVRHMVGREIADLFGKRTLAKGAALLSVSGLTTDDGTIRDVSFEVAEGEIVGLAGLVGCGKSEVGLALAGGLRATGAVEVRGRPVGLHTPRDAIRAGIAFVPEDRRRSALFPTRSTAQNLSIAWGPQIGRAGLVSPGTEARMVDGSMVRFLIRAEGPKQPVLNLSGGNQQKVVLGRWLAQDPTVLVLSEPTRGVDIGAKAEVYRLIQDSAERGAGVLLISSELPELLGLADRILVMLHGRIVGEFDRASATEQGIVALALGADDEALAR